MTLLAVPLAAGLALANTLVSFQEEARDAELTRRLQAGAELTGEAWRSALIDDGALYFPARWPAGVPLTVTARTPAWLPHGTVLFLDPRDSGLRRARVGTFLGAGCGFALIGDLERLRHQELGTLAPGHHDVAVQLELRRADEGERWLGLHPWLDRYLTRVPGSERGVPATTNGEPRLPTLLSTAELVFPVEIVPTLDDAVRPVTSSEIDAAVAGALRLVREEDEELRECLQVASVPALAGIALSLDVELLRGDDVVEHLRYQPTDQVSLGPTPWIRLEGVTNLPPDRTLLRLRGTDHEVLRSLADRRWAGTVEVTLAEVLERPER
jgi:hypothetical protein